MSETVKEERISKVAKDLGVPPKDIIEHLRKVDPATYGSLNPNSRLDGRAVDLCIQEFAKDMKLAQEARKQKEEKSHRTTVTIEEKEKTELSKEENEVDFGEISFLNPEILEKEEKPASGPSTISPAKISDDIVSQPSFQKISEALPAASEEKSESHQALPGPKVVGKIDLPEAPSAKSKSSKKKTVKDKDSSGVEGALPRAETPEGPTEAATKSIAPEKETTDQAPDSGPAVPEPLQPMRQEPELIRGTVEKLSGPKILGSITLREEPPKSKDSSKKQESQTPGETKDKPKEKKKRRRIISSSGKIDVEKVVRSTDAADERFRGGKDKPGEGQPASTEDFGKRVRENLRQLEERKKAPLAALRRKKKEKEQLEREMEKAQQEAQKKVLRVAEFVPASELAKMMDVQVQQVIQACMELGRIISINQRLDAELITVIAESFGYTVELGEEDIQAGISDEPDDPSQLKPRPPVVTVMGHVDHGKTSLLDYIRKTNVIAGEAGGITQHIGAYAVELEDGRHITFIDTPGHEAFTAMRARGAKVTDVAIIVIAADDSVMPQTVEAINHAQAAGVPIVFAFNKMDKPGANADKIREALANMNILVEEWGGKYQSQEISAKTGMGVSQLLEKVLLEADILELKANPNRRAQGTVIEASLDKGRGYLATILVQNGTLRTGDILLAGSYSGKAKALFNERGQKIDAAGPSTPVRVLGLDGAPQAGDKFVVLDDEKEARELANKRQQLLREQGLRARKHITLDEISRRISIGEFKQLNIIIKGDTDGSIEALADALLKLSTDKIQVNILHKSVGPISESDVLLASASDAILIGFNVRPSPKAKNLAEKEQIDVRSYSVIYRAIDEVKSAMEGMLAPVFEEKVTANIEVREVFHITRVGKVAGCYVLDGKVSRTDKIRVIRNGIVLHSGEIDSLKRFKDDVKEVNHGYECGISIKNFNDIQVGDILETYAEVPVTPKL